MGCRFALRRNAFGYQLRGASVTIYRRLEYSKARWVDSEKSLERKSKTIKLITDA